MNARRAWSVTRRIFQGLTHEPRTIVLIFLAPVLAIFVFGFAFSGEVRGLRVMLVNQDKPVRLLLIGKIAVGERIAGHIDQSTIELVPAASEEEGVRAVEEGRAAAVLLLPPDLSRNLAERLLGRSPGAPATIMLRLDRTVVNVANAVSRAVLDAVLAASADSGQRAPITLDVDRPIYGAHATFMDFFLPGVMGFACFFLTAILTILSFVGERRLGTLERLLATPLREAEIVAGYAVFFSVVGMLQSTVLLAIALLVFRVTIVGSLPLAFVTVALLSVVSLSLGILLSSFARTETQAVQMIPLIVLPVFLLAGIFWPVEAIPTWLRPLSWAIPVSWAVDACRSVMVRGWGLSRVWSNLLALVGFAAAFLVAASLSLRRRRAG